MLICIESIKYQKAIKEFHEGVCGGNFSPTTIEHRIMRDGYY